MRYVLPGDSMSNYLFNVVVFFFLSVGGLCLAGEFNPEKAYFPLVLVICSLPLGLFMKYTLKISKIRFIFGIILLAVIGVFSVIEERFGVESEAIHNYSIIVILLFCLLSSRFDKEETENSI